MRILTALILSCLLGSACASNHSAKIPDGMQPQQGKTAARAAALGKAASLVP